MPEDEIERYIRVEFHDGTSQHIDVTGQEEAIALAKEYDAKSIRYICNRPAKVIADLVIRSEDGYYAPKDLGNPHRGYEHLPAFCPNCGY